MAPSNELFCELEALTAKRACGIEPHIEVVAVAVGAPLNRRTNNRRVGNINGDPLSSSVSADLAAAGRFH